MGSEDLQVGDVVRLASGGPRMTVTDVRDDGGGRFAWCGWFANAKFRAATFPPAALLRIEARGAATYAPPLRITSLSLDESQARAVGVLVEVFGIEPHRATEICAAFQGGIEFAFERAPVLDWPRENIVAHLCEAGFTVAD